MSNVTDFLTQKIETLISPMGFELVHLETQIGRQKVLRIFIDHQKGIGIEDCVSVTHLLNEQLDQMPEMEELFKGNYELEVSSPGVDRPLRKETDFIRFKDRDVEIHLSRPLTAEESNNAEYVKKHPKQKDFVGTLKDFQNATISLAVKPDDGSKKAAKGKPQKKNPNLPIVQIPFELVSKCNLHPEFDF